MDDTWAEDTAFMGKVTAGATHEIRNVLSIIKESAGLMGDLMDMNKESFGVNEEKFRRMIDNIGAQVDRGAIVSKELNNLAHAPDQRPRTVDIRSVLKCQSILYERFSRQKQISLKLEANGQDAHMETDPVRLHRLIGTVVDILLERVSSGGTMVLKTEIIDEKISIIFSVIDSDGAPQRLIEAGNQGNDLDMAMKLGASIGFSFELFPEEGFARLTYTAGSSDTN